VGMLYRNPWLDFASRKSLPAPRRSTSRITSKLYSLPGVQRNPSSRTLPISRHNRPTRRFFKNLEVRLGWPVIFNYTAKWMRSRQ
jgi:hypothetical protein